MTKTKLKTFEVKAYINNSLIVAPYPNCKNEIDALERSFVILKKTWVNPIYDISFEIKEVLDSKK